MTNHLHQTTPPATPPAAPAAVRTGVSSTHGKAILLGDHSVVYGAPAIVLPVTGLVVSATATPIPDDDVRAADGHHLESTVHTGPVDAAPAAVLPTVTAVTATLRHLADRGVTGTRDARLHVRVDSEVPTARGMGSSAAVAAAVVGAVADALGAALTPDELFDLTQECERIAHGRPSGLDARGVLADAPVWFDQVPDPGAANGTARRAEPLHVPVPLTLVVADTGVPGHTREAVGDVRAARDRDPARVDGIVAALADVARDGRRALESGDARALGGTMDAAHELLVGLDVSSPDLDRLVAAARGAGALGAKLTGGGRGGCMLALAEDADHAAALGAAFDVAGARATWTTLIGAPA